MAPAKRSDLHGFTQEVSRGGGGSRIYLPGGRPVQLGEFPFLALLVIFGDNENYSCSGSIPSPTTVLTSAHCGVGAIIAYAGTVSKKATELRDAELQARSVEGVVKHEYPEVADIMICHVNESWVWSKFVAPVTLNLNKMSLQPSFLINCQVMGFGETEPDSGTGVAHVMDQLVGSSSQCMGEHVLFYFLSLYMCSVNVQNKTICGGDSGGPAVCSGQQWAVNMGVVPPNKTCVAPKNANLYVYIAFFRSWILNNIKDLPSSDNSIHRLSVKISMNQALLYPPIWLLFPMTVVLLYLNLINQVAPA